MAGAVLFGYTLFHIKSYAILSELTGWHIKGVKTTPIGAFQQTRLTLYGGVKNFLSQ